MYLALQISLSSFKTDRGTVSTSTHAAREVLLAAMRTRRMAMLVGAPATTKSVTIRTIADQMGYALFTIVGSRMEASDLSGAMKVEQVWTDDEGRAVYGTVLAPHSWQIEVLRKKKVILFFDEFSNTKDDVRASMLTILQDREFPNGQRMPEETILVGAMNPVAEAADGSELDIATSNRMLFIPWDPPVSEWLEGMRKGFGKQVSQKELAWKLKVAKFIEDRPSFLHIQPDPINVNPEVYGVDTSNESEMEIFRNAWPSRRSWDNVSVVLSETPASIPIQDMVIRGLVGPAAANAFRDWLSKNDSLSPHEVLADPSRVDWNEISLNDSNLLFRSVVDGIDQVTAEPAIALFKHVAEAGRTDIAAPYVLKLFKAVTNKNFPREAIERNKTLAREVAILYRDVIKKNND